MQTKITVDDIAIIVHSLGLFQIFNIVKVDK